MQLLSPTSTASRVASRGVFTWGICEAQGLRVRRLVAVLWSLTELNSWHQRPMATYPALIDCSTPNPP